LDIESDVQGGEGDVRHGPDRGAKTGNKAKVSR